MVRLAMLKYSSDMAIREAMHLRPGPTRVVTRLLAAFVTLVLAGPGYVCAQDKPGGSAGDAQVAKAVGTIKSIQADSITIAAASGAEVTAKLMGSTKILRVLPGEKNLKNATAVQ